eukprot:gnl/MRDRNA2_/MRDRNA2_82922_c0_seq1.p1 gnl/MRDRNA2_/MRDRNA2_82922_c0~~gnl/MRDRNA2_/MRDRNA2_82922_c0_seq1.p1  ORF type:complete len:759 (+),score=196.34 gnl/MRDRNA2_/MRDRNA2_82922_c0_seq1:124-2400(+)
MEKVKKASRSLTCLVSSADLLASGVQRLSTVLAKFGEDLQQAFDDSVFPDELLEDEKEVKSFFLAWREVGEVTEVLSSQMKALGDSLNSSSERIEAERVQRMKEAQNLDAAMDAAEEMQFDTFVEEDDLNFQPRTRVGKFLGWLTGASKEPELDEAEEARLGDKWQATNRCLEMVGDQMMESQKQHRRMLPRALAFARLHAMTLGTHIMLLRSTGGPVEYTELKLGKLESATEEGAARILKEGLKSNEEKPKTDISQIEDRRSNIEILDDRSNIENLGQERRAKLAAILLRRREADLRRTKQKQQDLDEDDEEDEEEDEENGKENEEDSDEEQKSNETMPKLLPSTPSTHDDEDASTPSTHDEEDAEEDGEPNQTDATKSSCSTPTHHDKDVEEDQGEDHSKEVGGLNEDATWDQKSPRTLRAHPRWAPPAQVDESDEEEFDFPNEGLPPIDSCGLKAQLCSRYPKDWATPSLILQENLDVPEGVDAWTLYVGELKSLTCTSSDKHEPKPQPTITGSAVTTSAAPEVPAASESPPAVREESAAPEAPAQSAALEVREDSVTMEASAQSVLPEEQLSLQAPAGSENVICLGTKWCPMWSQTFEKYYYWDLTTGETSWQKPEEDCDQMLCVQHWEPLPEIAGALTLMHGDRLQVTWNDDCEDRLGWAYGSVVGEPDRTGYFPRKCLVVPRRSACNFVVGKTYVVSEHFEAPSGQGGYLSVAPGDIIIVLYQDPASNLWVYAKRGGSSEKGGWLPEAVITV